MEQGTLMAVVAMLTLSAFVIGLLLGLSVRRNP